jgi:hypothetical protein
MKYYGFKRELLGIKDQWHKIILPDEIFEKISLDFSDIRIYGFNDDKEVVEAPYILKLLTEIYSQKEVPFKLINESKNEKGFYYTFEVPTVVPVNLFNLNFRQLNFDWKIALEGSQNQQEWFNIIEGYRILAIKNDITDFQFTKVVIPSSKFQYFRLFIESKNDPELISAKISLDDLSACNIRNYSNIETKTIDSKKNKDTTISIDLKTPVPVCKIKIDVKDKFDYYRPITIQYLSGKVKTQQGFDYLYSSLASGTLNSLEKNEFKFNSTVIKNIRIIISNQDNEPLNINSIQAEGYVYELIARFAEPGDYFLTYGNNNIGKPDYDISRFEDKIPKIMTALQLAKEELIEKDPKPKPPRPYLNQNSLWLVMILIIVILGWFSIKMIKQKQ